MNTEPCNHIWQWVDDDHPYFECVHCDRQAEYNPADLADMEQEYGGVEHNG